jgi:hypothetical protein
VLKPTQNNAFQKLEMADDDNVRLNFFLKNFIKKYAYGQLIKNIVEAMVATSGLF